MTIKATRAARCCGERRKCDDYEHRSSLASGDIGSLRENCNSMPTRQRGVIKNRRKGR